MTDSIKMDVDLYLKQGTIINVYSGELVQGNIAIYDGRIVYVGPSEVGVGRETRILNIRDHFVSPGYVEPHCHPWGIYNPLSIGELACRRGTTTIFCDNLLFFMLMDIEMFELFMDEFASMPIKYFWFCRATPQTPIENEKEQFSFGRLKRLLLKPHVQSLGEITRWVELIDGNVEMAEIISFTKELKKRVDGHTAGAKWEKLNRLAMSGIESCHESITGQDVIDRLRLGFHVMLRESSLRPDLKVLIKPIIEQGVKTNRLSLTTDGSMPEFYCMHGVTDYLIKTVINEGVDPICAYQMATINPAVYFGLDHRIGGIAPGRDADMVILTDIREPTPITVISKGKIVSERGCLIEEFPKVQWNTYFDKSSFNKKKWLASKNLFSIAYPHGCVRFPVIKLLSPAITKIWWAEFPCQEGFLSFDLSRFCLVSLISRDGDWITTGIVEGFASKLDGLASSYNTAAQILVIGQNAEAMSTALNMVIGMKGGIVVCEDAKKIYELRLPLGGIMSEYSVDEVAVKEKELKTLLVEKGYPYHDPLFSLVFLPCDFLPEGRVTCRGILNSKTKKVLWPRRELI